MNQENVVILKRGLALAISSGNTNDTLRQLKNMALEMLEAISNQSSKEIIENSHLDAEQNKILEGGLEKLDFYVCGILMHRILEEK